MKSSDAVAEFLVRHDITYCYDLVGGMITHLLDSLSKRREITITPMHHEQGAAFCAEGIARATRGKEMGLAMGTSGPGATNLITGISSCWFDSVPCLFITGQVNETELRGDLGVRQQGFQELDIVSMVKGVTKYCVQVRKGESFLPELHKACSAAMSGRKGPVLLDVTFNAQREEVDDDAVESWAARPWDVEPAPSIDRDIEELAAMCATSRKPLVCLGGGAVWADSLEQFRKFLERKNVPYVTTLMGAQWVTRNDLYYGMLGTYGRRSANWAVQNCDLLIAIGSRLDVRQTGAFADDFARNAKIVQVDIDPSQLNNRVSVDLGILSDAEKFVTSVIARDLSFGSTEEWTRELAEMRRRLEFDEYTPSELTPHRFFQTINELSSGESIDYVSDVGNHQMWTACLLDLDKEQRMHFSGGLGAMGFGLPASVGIAMRTGKKVINITGDGSVQINIQELDTLKRLDLDVCVIVLNNSALGMVKNFQDMYFDGNNQSTVIGYSNPDFVSVANAYGLKACRVTNTDEFRKAFHESLGYHHPSLIEVMVQDGHECKPRLAFGGKLDEQFPPLNG
ncbi:MAG: thiamine pyrophosphate-binding protein [Methanomassiliicoccales archaeon]